MKLENVERAKELLQDLEILNKHKQLSAYSSVCILYRTKADDWDSIIYLSKEIVKKIEDIFKQRIKEIETELETL